LTRFNVLTGSVMTRTQCYNWTKPDTLQFKWKNSHSRAIPLVAKYTLLFCFSNWKCTTCDVIFMDWVKIWQGVFVGSGYGSACSDTVRISAELVTLAAPPWQSGRCVLLCYWFSRWLLPKSGIFRFDCSGCTIHGTGFHILFSKVSKLLWSDLRFRFDKCV